MVRFVSLIALAAALAVPAFAQAADKPAEKAAEAAPPPTASSPSAAASSAG